MVGLWLLSMNNAYAAIDLSTALRNLRDLVIPLTQLLLAFSFVAGIYMIWHAVIMMKKFGAMTNMQSQPGEFTGPLAYLIIGAILVWIPSTSNILTSSIFGDKAAQLFTSTSFDYSAMGSGSELLAYASGSSLQAQWTAIADTLVLYIQFIGFVAFIRGWLIVAKASQTGAQHGSMSKGVTHIIGGIIAINFVQFVHLLEATLGM
jgi:intracellular multiplication protein IcmC